MYWARIPLLFVSLFMILVARADFINLIRADQCETIIEVFIDKESIRITYEVGSKDLVFFMGMVREDLRPDTLKEMFSGLGLDDFFNRGFIVSADGKVLTGTISRQEYIGRIYRSSLYTGKVDTNKNISPVVLLTEIIYPLQNKPRVVSFIPPMEAGYLTTHANIGFVTYHKQIPVNDLRYLGREETVKLDWEDPWYSRFENPNLRRHHQSSLMSFLYIDPYEVRHEVLVRIMDLKPWLDLPYELGDYIEIEDQDSLKVRVASFLAGRNPVMIDGETKPPLIDKVQFVKWSLAGIQIQEMPERLDYSSAVIGVILAWPHDSIAQQVIIDWDMFSDRITQVPQVSTDPAGPMPFILNPDDNILTWTNYLKKYELPTVTKVEVQSYRLNLAFASGMVILFIGMLLLIYTLIRKLRFRKQAIIGIFSGILLVMASYFIRFEFTLPFLEKSNFTEPEAQSLMIHLLKNTYRAFDFREESDIYDKLAVSNTGDMLTDVYLQTKRSMVLENQGGIQVKVKDIEMQYVEQVDPDRADGLAFRCRWIVRGDVGHWGHIHRRTNQYDAILTVVPESGSWKLSGIDIIEEQRL